MGVEWVTTKLLSSSGQIRLELTGHPVQRHNTPRCIISYIRYSRRWHKTLINMVFPTLSQDGKAALDGLLDHIASNRTLPGVFYGVCSADSILYEAQGGSFNYEDTSKGEVKQDTSE
jgi:hypothetical protein